MWSFDQIYTNQFIGSGNLCGKYWIIGLESGGEIEWDNNEDDFIKSLKNDKLIEYINDFSETDISKRGFNGQLYNIVCAFKKIEIHKDIYSFIKENENKIDFLYPKNGSVFRTNLLLLKLEHSTNKVFNKQIPFFRKYFNDIPKNINKNDLYRKEIIKERAKSIKFKLDRDGCVDSEKIIILMVTRSRNDWYEKQAINFLSIIFDTQITIKLDKSKYVTSTQKSYYYSDSNNKIKVFSFPQSPNYSINILDYSELL